MARPNTQKKHLIDKYKELVWALSLQDYNNQDIGTIMNRTRSVISRVINERPKNYQAKWVKVS